VTIIFVASPKAGLGYKNLIVPLIMIGRAEILPY
jgi:hypothetical protein